MKAKKLISLLLSVAMLLGLFTTSVVTSSAEATKVGRVWEWGQSNYGVSVDSDTAVGTDPSQGLFLHYKGNKVVTPNIILSSWNGGTFSANAYSEGSLGYINRATYLKFKISIGQMLDANGASVSKMAVVFRMTVDGVVYTLKSSALDVPNEQLVEQFTIANFVKADDASVAIDMTALRNGSEITDFQIDLASYDGSQIKNVEGYLLGVDAYDENGSRIGTVWDWTQDAGNFTANGGSIDSFVPWSGEFGNGAPHYVGDDTLRDAITFTSWNGGCYSSSGATIGSLNNINNADYLQIDYNVNEAYREDGTAPEKVAVTMNLVVGGTHYHNTQLAANLGTTTLVYKVDDFVKSDDTSVTLSKEVLRSDAGKSVGDGYVSDMSMAISFSDGSNIKQFNAYIIGVDAYDIDENTTAKATFDNGVADVVAINGMVTMPKTTIEGKQLLGWQDANGALYAAGAKVAITEDTAFTAVAADIALQTGAGIRWAKNETERGIRFETYVTKAALDSIGSSSFELGALILPYEDYQADITVENNYGAINVVDPKVYGSVGENYRYYTGVVDFEKYFAVSQEAMADLKLTAVSYIKVTYADATVGYFYDHPDATNNVRSVAEVARAALADTEFGYTEDQKAILNLYKQYSKEETIPEYRKDDADKVA